MPTSIIKSLNQLTKGAEIMMHSAVLLRSQVADLQKANEAASKHRQRKKKRIQKQGTLTKAEGSKIITQKDVGVQIQGKRCQKGLSSNRNAIQQRRCRHCGKTGHNTRTCQKDAEITVD